MNRIHDVTHDGPARPTPSVAAAVAGYLATLDHPETAGTRRVYSSTLRQLVTTSGPDQPPTVLAEAPAADELVAWFTDRWGAKPRRRSTATRTRCGRRSATGASRTG